MEMGVDKTNPDMGCCLVSTLELSAHHTEGVMARGTWPEGPGCDLVNLVSDSSRHLATLLSSCLLVVVVIISHH
jgi:hypothetical protein